MRVGRGGGERLTEDQRKELRSMRKRQKAEHRKKKILKMDEEGVSAITHTRGLISLPVMSYECGKEFDRNALL